MNGTTKKSKKLFEAFFGRIEGFCCVCGVFEVKKSGERRENEVLTGFEPVISCLLDRRFNQLSHRTSVMALVMKYAIST